MWASAQVWLRGSIFEIASITNMTILAILLITLLTLLSIGFVMFQNRLWSIYFGIIVGVTYSLLFKVSNINLVGMFILALLFYHAQNAVISEIQERIKMNSRLLIKKGLFDLVIALFILTSFAAYQSPAIEQFKNIQQLPSSGEVFIRTIVEQTLGDQLDEASLGQKESVFSQVTQEIVGEANVFLQPYFEYAPPALAFGLFLVLWSVGWIFVWLSVFLGILLFWILRKIKFFKMEGYDVKAEKIAI